MKTGSVMVFAIAASASSLLCAGLLEGCDGKPAAPADTARRFVVCDPLLRAPAACYRLEPGWDAMGWIAWNAAARKNQYVSSVVLFNAAQHKIVQETSPISEEQQLLNTAGAEWRDANLMAQTIAARINPGIVVPGLEKFVAKGGRFSDDVPAKRRAEIEKVASMTRAPGLTHKVFKVECFFDCVYGGVPCDAKYEFVALYYVSHPMPKLPAIGWSIDYDTRLVVAPRGKLAEAASEGGKMIAGAFVNQTWKAAQERMMLAIATGKMIGANEGFELMKQSQAETQRTMDEIRRKRSEQIREVKTVDNPFSPGEKFERPAFFDHSWMNSSQDALLLSDKHLEPNTIRGLIEMGDWRPVD